MIERDRRARPLRRPRRRQGRVGENIEHSCLFNPRGDDAAIVGALAGTRRRIDGDDDALERRRLMDARALQHVARPQRVLALVEDFAVEFLASQSRAGILRDDAFEKGRRKIGGVLARQGAGHDARRIGDQLLEERQRTRRRGHQLTRPVAETQAKLQHVPCLPGVAPFGEFVAPGGVKLRPAQAFRIFRRKRLRHGARVPRRARLRVVSQRGRSRRPCTASRPETPSTITSRTSAAVSPISAMRPSGRIENCARPSASAFTHSAPARVLPAPRPPRISHVRHGVPFAARCGGH